MDNGFDYKGFASHLAFQVRPLVLEKYSGNEKDIQNIVYSESFYWGEKIADLNKFNYEICQYIVQIIAEWTFHKYIDLLVFSCDENTKRVIIRKINSDLYAFLITHIEEPVRASDPLIARAEIIVKNSYRKYLEQFEAEKKISKKELDIGLKQSNIDEISQYIENENLYSVPVSIFDVLKVQVGWSLMYIIGVPWLFCICLRLFQTAQLLKGTIYLIIFCILLFQFLTREVPISINMPNDEN